MAKPAFIYAFDNLGPERFTELCGLLLASRHKGFLLGGVGADGGIDAELDSMLGVWNSETREALLNEVIQPSQKVIFQFKHLVTGRAGGQSKARERLLDMYNCRKGYMCEVHRELIVRNKPDCYVLVTNVEINSNWRAKFIEHCKAHNPGIERFQVIGLDELETWVTSDVELRHLYFPTIYGQPRFHLQVNFSEGIGVPVYNGKHKFGESESYFFISVLNVGVAASYVSSLSFKAIVDRTEKNIFIVNFGNELLKLTNPEPGAVVEPGRKLDYGFPFQMLRKLLKTQGTEVFPYEVRVYDEIGNVYSSKIPENLIDKIMQ